MSDLTERIKDKIQARRWKFARDTSPYEGECMQWANRMNTWCLEIIDEESAKEEQDVCEWSKGLHSYITCWSDVAIKDYKKYAMRFCPHCGRKIKVI